jgi:tetratricopeptide (TPR) repeat protein
MDSALKVQKGFEDLAAQTFRFDRQAIALLGIRTSSVVATILSIPDAIALIPGSSTITAWVLAIVGCWITAVVLWFVFFVGFLNVIRLVTGGIKVGPDGVKLWRLGRLLPWESIIAVSVDDEGIFSRMFSFERSVKRLTLFTHIESKSEFLRTMVVPHYVASFYYSESDFKELCRSIAKYKFGVETEDRPVLLSPLHEIPAVRKAHVVMRWQRVLISIIITLSVGMFLARKAVVFYSYNEGQKAYRLKDYSLAEQRFLTSVSIEKSFAPAWHGLASSEFHLGKFVEAQQHWKEALKWKPDYVEAKVSLAYMNLQQRKFNEAEKLINSALALAPANPTALLNRADLYLRTGHILEATQDARLVVAQTETPPTDRDIFMATCLLAQAKLLQGKPTEAAAMLAPLPVTEARLGMGENLTYRLIVGSQIALALGQTNKAEKLARLALARGTTLDSLLLMAQVEIARKDYDVAQTIVEKCRATMPSNPWIYITASEINLERKHTEQACTNLKAALECKPMDALCLARIADIYSRLGKAEDAVAAAKLSIQMEPTNPIAQAVLEKLCPESMTQ